MSRANRGERISSHYRQLLGKLIEWKMNNPEKYNMAIFAITHQQQSNHKTRLLNITPAGSPIETILNVFDKATNIPLELPVFSFINCVAAYLANKKIEIHSPRAGLLFTDLWSIVLAPSGASKTFSFNQILKSCPVAPNLTQPAGAAAFIQTLSEHNPAFWFQDEIAQLMYQIDRIGTPMSDIKPMMLMAYSNQKIERTTKGQKGSQVIKVEKPILNFFGINTYDSYLDSMSADSMNDGFMQRFLYVKAERDENKNTGDYAFYDIQIISPAVASAWDKIQALTLHSQYYITDAAELKFAEYFSEFWRQGKVNESFYRRIMFTALKYALIMHILTGKNNQEIDEVDIAYACRICRLHLDDTAQVICDKLEGADKIKKQLTVMKNKGIESLNERKISRSFSGGEGGYLSADESRILLDIAKSLRNTDAAPIVEVAEHKWGSTSTINYAKAA